MDGIGEVLSLFEIWRRSFAPDKIAVWSVGKAPGNGRIEATMHFVETFRRSLTSEEFVVNWVNIAGDEMRAVRIGTSNEDSGNDHNMGSTACSDQVVDSSLCW